MLTQYAPSTLDDLTRRLERRRTSIAELLVLSRRDATAALEDLDVSDLLDSDDPDPGTNIVDRGHALAVATAAAAHADAIEGAIARLNAGDYGTCEDCGTRIGLARLRALPETTVCVDCKSAARPLLAR